MPDVANSATVIESPESPAIRSLIADLAETSRKDEVLAAFWAKVASVGAPLIEAEDAADHTVLATFVWREDAPCERVSLIEWATGHDYRAKQMTRVEGTDVWYRSLRIRDNVRTQYCIGPDDSMVSIAEEPDLEARVAKWRRDPLNRTPLVNPDEGSGEDESDDFMSIAEMPNAPAQPWVERRHGVSLGTVEHLRFSSELLGNERDIWIYRPAEHPGDTPALVMTFDGEGHRWMMKQPEVYDNLAASGKVRPFFGVMIGNVDRGTELPCNPTFLAMLKDELLPWLETKLEVTFEAQTTVVGGASYGGLAAMYAGLFAPERFGRVISLSGSYWWKPDPFNAEHPLKIGDAGNYAWLPNQAATIALGDIEVWMDVGVLEDRTHLGIGPTQVSSNHHMRDVLVARGVPVTYSEYIGGHDWSIWRNSLAVALIKMIPPA